MTVKELIKSLKKFNPETIVSVEGYEGGISDKICLKEVDALLNKSTAWYYGEHEEIKFEKPEPTDKVEKRIVISREK